MNRTNDQLLTYEEAATMLRISPVTLRKWVSNGRLPYKKLGRKAVRFNQSELKEWIDKQSIGRSV